MREIVFRAQQSREGGFSARSDHPQLSIEAASREELQHEAREALIAHFGPSHVACRVRICWPNNPAQPGRRRGLERVRLTDHPHRPSHPVTVHETFRNTHG